MNRIPFEGFSAGLFQFLGALAQNNNKAWFDEHRLEYRTEVLAQVKAFASGLGATLNELNQELETEPRVGRTVSGIIDSRLNRGRASYRPIIFVRFPRRGAKLATEPFLHAGIYPEGILVGFEAGHHAQHRTGRVQEAIRANLRMFQRYLDERNITSYYWELTGGEDGQVTKWPLPKTARRWANLDSFTVGDYFPASDPLVIQRGFIDRAKRIMLDLYPLWLFASSDNLRDDFKRYRENAALLSRPSSKASRPR